MFQLASFKTGDSHEKDSRKSGKPVLASATSHVRQGLEINFLLRGDPFKHGVQSASLSSLLLASRSPSTQFYCATVL